MARGRSALAALVFFGSALVLVTGSVLWAVRGAMPEMWAVPMISLSVAWFAWRHRHPRGAPAVALWPLIWSALVTTWMASGETLLAATAVVPTVASLCLTVLDTRDYLASDAAPRPPADPVLAARLRRAAFPLWAFSTLSAGAAVMLGFREACLAFPGIALAALFGALAWLTPRGVRPRGALPIAAVLGASYGALGVLAYGGSLWGQGLPVVLGLVLLALLLEILLSLAPTARKWRFATACALGVVLVAYGALIVAGVVSGVGPAILLAFAPALVLLEAIASLPPKPPPVPRPAANR